MQCNQERMLIKYRKLILGKGAKIKKIIKFIHENGANITMRILSINNQFIIYYLVLSIHKTSIGDLLQIS